MVLTKPDEGWAWVVMVASFGAHVVTGCFLYAVGVIHNALLERFNEDVSKTAWAGAIYLTLVNFAGIGASLLINRYSCRVSMIIGGTLMTVGFVASALLPTLDGIIVSYGVIAGIGAGLCYSAHVVVLGFNFKQRRNFASGIAVAGCGVGTLALAPVMEAAREKYGDADFFFILAGFSMHMILFGTLFFPTKLEKQRRIEYEKRAFEKENMEPKKRTLCSFFFRMINYFKVLKKLAFTCFCGSMFFANIGIYLVYVHFARYVVEMKSTAAQAAYLLSLNGLCNTIARMLAGMASNAENVDELLIYFGTFASLGLSTILFPLFSATLAGQAIYSAILGMYSGCCYSVINSLIVRFAGMSYLATGFGIVMLFSSFGMLIGPPLAGFIVDSGGTYEQSFIIAGLTITLAALLGLCTTCFHSEEDKSRHSDTVKIISEPHEKEQLCVENDIRHTESALEKEILVLPTQDS